MKLIELTLKECKELEMASFQREQGKSKVKDLYDFFVKKGKYVGIPILINGNNKVIDGGHRVKAFIKAKEDGLIKGNILALRDAFADKQTFLNVNKGTPVPINHKVKIHSKIEHLIKNGASLSYKTSGSSLSYVDFARCLCIIDRHINQLRLKQSSQKEIQILLDKISITDVTKLYYKIYTLKDMYFNSLKKYPNRKYMQKLFLYIVAISFKINLKENDMDRIVNKFPMSLGGDIGLAYNKQVFVDAYNFNIKKECNRISIDIL